jgi:hypothetical protein
MVLASRHPFGTKALHRHRQCQAPAQVYRVKPGASH